MMYNYFQLVEAHQVDNSEDIAREQFIINNRDRDSGRPLDLIYPNDEVACYNGSSYYALAEPLNRVTPGWDRRALLSGAERSRLNTDDDPDLEVTADNIEDVLRPVLDSLDRNTPVLAYTGLSTNAGNPRHIIVVSGYKRDEEGTLWLHFTDPSTMRNSEAGDKGRLLEPVDETGRPPRSLIDILDEGDWAAGEADGAASRYWLKALRLFEAQQESTDADDIWLDHAGSPNLTVWIHDSHETPDSPYAHSLGLTAALPVDLGEGLEATPEAIEHAYRIIETGPGGYFPVGAEQVWHGGVHLPTPGGADQLVHAPLPGRVVAARLDASAGRRNNHYGSSRFVLLAHDPAALLGPHVPDVEDPFDGETLFSLLMHLGPPEGDLGGEIPAEHDLAWLRGAPTACRATGALIASPTPGLMSATPLGTAGDVFGWTSEDEITALPVLRETDSLEDDATWFAVRGPDGQVGYLHEATVTANGDGTVTPRSLSKNVRPIPSTTDAVWGDRVDADETLTLRDTEAPEGWRPVRVGDADRFIPADAPVEPTRFRVHEQARAALESSEVEVFDADSAPTVAAGDPIAPAGVYGSPGSGAELLHWELFTTGDTSLYAQYREALREQHLSEMPGGEDPPVLVEFAEATDPNDDGKLTDTGAITEILAEPAVCTPGATPVHGRPGTAASVLPDLLADGTLTREEVSRFYAGHPGALRLRRFACQFVGEWRTVPQIYDFFSAESVFGSASEMMWWTDVAEAGSGADLPADGRAWYYHPVRLLSLVAEPPAVPEAGLVQEVTGPAQIVPGHPAAYEARLANHTFSTAADRASISWVVTTVDGERELERHTGRGPTWTYRPTLGELGEAVRAMAYVNSEERDVSQVSEVVSGLR